MEAVAVGTAGIAPLSLVDAALAVLAVLGTALVGSDTGPGLGT